MVTFRRTYQVKFVSGRFEYDLLLTTDNDNYIVLEKQVKDYMKKEYRVQSGKITITPLELGILNIRELWITKKIS